MNKNMLQNLSDDELLRYVDRSDPYVNELASRLEEAINILDEYESNLSLPEVA